jgi:hypothetical protein
VQLIYPAKPRKDFSNLEELPKAMGGGSGYFTIAVVKSGFDIYVCFCNAERDKVFIEKTTTLNKNKFLCFEDLTYLQDEEFKTIHKFLIDAKVLNG